MSDKIITLNDQMEGHRRNRHLEPTSINRRLQWMAALVCAILDAENTKPSSSMVKRPPET